MLTFVLTQLTSNAYSLCTFHADISRKKKNKKKKVNIYSSLSLFVHIRSFEKKKERKERKNNSYFCLIGEHIHL